MQSHRIISGLTIVAMIVVVAAGWFLFASPQVASAQAAAAQVSSAEAQVASEQSKVAALKADTGKLGELQTRLASLQQSIPGDLDAAPFVRQLSSMADEFGVTVSSVTVSDAVYYAAPAGTGGSAAGAGGSTPSPAPSASPAPAASAANAWAPPTDPAITPANFITIPVQITFKGDWGKTLAFLNALQTGPRLYLVTKVNANAAGDDGSVEMSTTGLIYATQDAAAPRSMTGLDPKKAATPTPAPTTAAPKPAATTAAAPSATPTPSASASASGK